MLEDTVLIYNSSGWAQPRDPSQLLCAEKRGSCYESSSQTLMKIFRQAKSITFKKRNYLLNHSIIKKNPDISIILSSYFHPS